jgi:hypothetical protein
VLADADAGRARGDGAELAADFGGRVGLEVEAVQLRETAGEEDVDHRAGVVRGAARVGRDGADERLAQQPGGKAADADLEEIPPVVVVIAARHVRPPHVTPKPEQGQSAKAPFISHNNAMALVLLLLY